MNTTALRQERDQTVRPLQSVKSDPRIRIDAIDLARGMAVTLMILSHGVKGLLTFEQMPAWGLVPIHLFTKFSSSLFILVFGLSLAVVYAPHVDTPAWPRKRNRMLIRGLKVFFWYKVLTIVEMTPQYSREDILSTLLYQAFPVYVEILGFYAIALVWLAFTLPYWQRTPRPVQWLVPVVTAFASWWLYHNFNFGSDILQAILVEHEKHYTWGQLARAPLVFLGLLLGAVVARWHAQGRGHWRAVALFASISISLFGAFYLISLHSLSADLVAIAKNEGKHPPELKFMLFSLGGAFLALAVSFAGGSLLAKLLRPITVIGKDALQAFICHIFVIFVFYRYLLNYWHTITYEKALWLTAVAIAITALWIQVLLWLKNFQRLRS